jgi:hypothetical protein
MPGKKKIIDWGDGTKIVVAQPDLSHLPAVMCPPACYPAEGDERMEIGFKKKVDVKCLPCSDLVE